MITLAIFIWYGYELLVWMDVTNYYYYITK